MNIMIYFQYANKKILQIVFICKLYLSLYVINEHNYIFPLCCGTWHCIVQCTTLYLTFGIPYEDLQLIQYMVDMFSKWLTCNAWLVEFSLVLYSWKWLLFWLVLSQMPDMSRVQNNHFYQNGVQFSFAISVNFKNLHVLTNWYWYYKQFNANYPNFVQEF